MIVWRNKIDDDEFEQIWGEKEIYFTALIVFSIADEISMDYKNDNAKFSFDRLTEFNNEMNLLRTHFSLYISSYLQFEENSIRLELFLFEIASKIKIELKCNILPIIRLKQIQKNLYWVEIEIIRNKNEPNEKSQELCK